MLFENIPVMPIQQMLGSPFGRSEHKLGPVWPDWDNAGSVRFFRKGKPKDDKPWVGKILLSVTKLENMFGVVQ